MKNQIIRPAGQSPCQVMEFSGIFDCLKFLDQHPESIDTLVRCGGIHPCDGDMSWFGRSFKRDNNHGWDDLKSSLKSTWKEGMDTFNDLLRKIISHKIPEPAVIRRQQVWDADTGEEYDLDRAKAGFEPWRTVRKRKSTGPRVITIAVDVDANSWVRASECFWRGVIAVILMDILENAGYMVEIIMYSYASNCYVGGESCFSSYRIKEADQMVSCGDIINMVSPWFLRAVNYRCNCISELSIKYGLGSAGRMPQFARELICDVEGEVWIVDDVWDEENSVKKIFSLLQSLENVEL